MNVSARIVALYTAHDKQPILSLVACIYFSLHEQHRCMEIFHNQCLRYNEQSQRPSPHTHPDLSISLACTIGTPTPSNRIRH